jgi:hypothetical protein
MTRQRLFDCTAFFCGNPPTLSNKTFIVDILASLG